MHSFYSVLSNFDIFVEKIIARSKKKNVMDNFTYSDFLTRNSQLFHSFSTYTSCIRRKYSNKLKDKQNAV